MISTADFFAGYPGNPGITAEHYANAVALLRKVNPLLEWAIAHGWAPKLGTHTHTMVSGQRDGGWRPQTCPIGAPGSAHKQGRAVDVADADGSLDALISQYDRQGGTDNDVLRQFGLFREAPSYTDTWCHLSDRSPPSGRRSFLP